MADATALLSAFKQKLTDEGTLLTVTRRAGTQGGAVTTTTAYALVQPMAATDDSNIFVEGTLNAQQDNPIRFVFAGDAVVGEGIDRIAYGGSTYRVTSSNTRVIRGTTVTLSVVGIRTT